MALTRDAIDTVRSEIKKMEDNLSLFTKIKTIEDELNSNNNYIKFINGTDIGKNENNKLFDLFSNIQLLGKNEISNTIAECNRLVDVQEQNNSAK